MPSVVILTEHRLGPACLCLPVLVREPGVEVRAIVYSPNPPASRRRKVVRDLRKTWRIGLLGALNGVRMRSWYHIDGSQDLFELASRLGVPVETSPRVNHPRTHEVFSDLAPDLGLTLGCGYIGSKLFRIPRYGMLNIHGENLPAYRGAASVVWSIHDGRRETGFTIHQVETKIDAGAIVYQETFPIAFRATLAETVRATVAEINRRVPDALARTVSNYETLRPGLQPQGEGRSFTTPTFYQYLNMLRQHRRLGRQQPLGG